MVPILHPPPWVWVVDSLLDRMGAGYSDALEPEEEAVLDNVTEYGQNFRDFLRPIVNPENPTTPEEIGTLRFYLRKIEGADKVNMMGTPIRRSVS